MGRAARWLRGLLGGGKKPDSGGSEPRPAREKKRWGFGKSFREKEKLGPQQAVEPPRPPRRVVGEQRGSYREAALPYAAGEGDDEQNKRAIAVAAATAAVAEAAVAAAQAAAAVVMLTSSGRSVAGGFGGGGGGPKREEWAAVKIQSAFRGYLARRALKALRGLVKLQALVRGNIVRKQAAETLRCMHALVRVQARARACRALRSESSRPGKAHRTHPGPPTPEKHEQIARTNEPKSSRLDSFTRNSIKSSRAVGRERWHSCSGRNWLDRWVEEKYGYGGRDAAAVDDDKSAKILEVDPGKPKTNMSKRRGGHLHSSCSTLTSEQNSRSFATVPDSPSKDSTTVQMSVPSPSSVNMEQGLSPLSPQFYSATSQQGGLRRGPFTPSQSECSRSYLGGYPDYPNYMANTESSRAKVRSHSAPKQRPEYEMMSSIRRPLADSFGQQQPMPSAQRSNSLRAKSGNKAYPGSGRLDRTGMPIRY